MIRYNINQVVKNKCPDHDIMIGIDCGEWVRYEDVKQYLPKELPTTKSAMDRMRDFIASLPKQDKPVIFPEG
jgi:hypothetical protein